MLVIAVLFPVWNLVDGLETMVHNQYKGRFNRLQAAEEVKFPSLHLGLTATELAALDRNTVFAYTDAVNDGYRLGYAYSTLWLESMALDGLLFISSVLGLLACRQRKQPPNHAM
jgi:hypothetical protein